MKRFRLSRIFISLFFISILSVFFGWLNWVSASGPGEGTQVRIDDERVGPYTMLVVTGPHPLKVGQLNVWVRVKHAAKNQIRNKATVMVEATHRSGRPTVTGPATHENAGNDFNYLAHLSIEKSGEWDVTVDVEDDPGSVDVSFTESVTSESNPMLLAILTIPFLVLTVGIGVYLWRRSGRYGAR